MAIQNWPNWAQPRERLLKFGAASLSDGELLAILFNQGIKGLSAMDLAEEAIRHFGGLYELLNCSLTEFSHYPGLNKRRYAQLQACLEISHRNCFAKIKNQPILENSGDTKQFLLGQLRNNPREIFACLLLNNQHRIINYRELFHGTIDQTEVHPREVIRLGLAENAAAMILVHNHPSGNCSPSSADKTLTKKLIKGLKYVSIRVIDHMIIGNEKIYSFAEHGLL